MCVCVCVCVSDSFCVCVYVALCQASLYLSCSMGCYKTTNNVTRFLLNENRGLELVTDRLGKLSLSLSPSPSPPLPFSLSLTLCRD